MYKVSKIMESTSFFLGEELEVAVSQIHCELILPSSLVVVGVAQLPALLQST